MMLVRVLQTGCQSLMLHKLRSFLTILGVVFGVGSVVSMLAVGEGASHEVRQRLLRLGPDRIMIRSKLPQGMAGGDVMVYGLTQRDVDRLRNLVPGVTAVASTYEIEKDFWADDREVEVRVVGTSPDFATIHHLEVQQGRFLAWTDIDNRASVAVLGATAASEMFGAENPIGSQIKHSSGHYRIVGVLSPRVEQSDTQYDPNKSIFIPLPTAKSRFENVIRTEDELGKRYERIEFHQIGLRVNSLDKMQQIASMVRRLMDRYHPQHDFEMIVPFELLKQTEHTKRVFTTVLGSVGGISMLVGGIGIMNIMLATVTERTREIGIRRALGAKRSDIVMQFLAESVILSSIGGILGIGLGMCVPKLVTQLSQMKTVVTPTSLVLALSISVAVGIIFGVVPARKAAGMEPVAALRHS